MFTIQVTFTTAEAAIECLARLRGIEAAAVPNAVPTTAKPAGSPPTAPAAGAAAKKPPASSGESAEDAAKRLYKPVGEAITAAAAANRPVVLATLAEFGAATGKDLKPEQYGDFLTKLTAAMTPAGDLG